MVWPISLVFVAKWHKIGEYLRHFYFVRLLVTPMKQRRRLNRGPSYGILEPRQLLAATGLAQFDGDTSIDTGLIVNGNFDQNDVVDGTAQHVAIAALAGWSQTDGASDTVSLVGFDDSPRGTGLHLDFQADVLESVFQDVNTDSGQLYTLAFDLRGRTVANTADATTNDIRILWDGAQVGTYRGITEFWQTFTVDVAGGSADLTRLEIQEVDGAGNDGIGPIIDNLRLVPVSSQTVENGSFEENSVGTVSEDDIPGWSVVGEDSNRSVDVQDGTASNGSLYLNLDRQAENSDVVYTDITTESGGIYFVSFDLRSESGSVGEDEEMRIRWNDTWVGTYRGNSDWQSFGFTVRADTDSTRLVFREPGNSFTGDGDGPLLDNVRIMQVVPTITVSLNDNSDFEFVEGDEELSLGSRIDAINTTVLDSISRFTVTLEDSTSEGLNENNGVVKIDGLASEVESVDGVLTFEESLTTDEFLTVLQTLKYENHSDQPKPGAQRISVQVFAGDVSSSVTTLTVNVTPVNDAPVVANIADGSAVVGEAFNVQATATDVEGDALTWTVSATGTAILSTDTQPSVDAQGNVSWTPARVGDATLTVRATDSGTLFNEKQFALSVTEEVSLDTGTITVNSGTDLPLYIPAASTDAAVGQTIAGFEAQTIDGGTFNSIEPGVARIYSMLAHWCPFCNEELPEIVEWLAENDLGDDIEFVAGAVAVDSTRDNYPAADWFDDLGYDGTIIVDNPQAKLMSIMGTNSFPFLVAVDASGQVVERISGVSTKAQLDSVLAALRS